MKIFLGILAYFVIGIILTAIPCYFGMFDIDDEDEGGLAILCTILWPAALGLGTLCGIGYSTYLLYKWLYETGRERRKLRQDRKWELEAEKESRKQQLNAAKLEVEQILKNDPVTYQIL